MAFRYKIIKKAVGNAPYTTRPDFGPPVTEEEIIRLLKEFTSLTEGQLRKAFAELSRIIINAALNGRGSVVLFGLFRISLACGGAIEDPQESLTAEDINPRMTINIGPAIQKEFRANLALERVPSTGDRVPEIEFVRNIATDNLDTYTPGIPLRVTGDDLKIQKSDPQQGAFLRPEDGGPEVRMSVYVDNTRGNLTFLVPADISGPQELIIRAKFGENLRESKHQTILIQE